MIVSWWNYSTPLWYGRWVEGQRPDVTIIDDRTILDDGYGTAQNAIDAFLGNATRLPDPRSTAICPSTRTATRSAGARHPLPAVGDGLPGRARRGRLSVRMYDRPMSDTTGSSGTGAGTSDAPAAATIPAVEPGALPR